MAALVCQALVPATIKQSGDSSTGGAAPISGVPTGFASDDSSSDSSSGSSGSFAVGGGQLACTLDQSATNTSSESSGSGTTSSKMSSFNLRNLTVTYFPTLGTIQVIGGSEGQIEMIRDYIAANDKKTPQAYLEVQIISLSESGSKEFSNTWSYMSKNFTFNANSSGFGNKNPFPIFFAGKGYNILGEWDTEKGEYKKMGYTGKNGSGHTLSYTMNYLIQNNKGRVLANPKIILTNGQESVIDLSSDYIEKVTTDTNNSSNLTNVLVTRQYDIGDDNGIKITIVPFISPDGYITMDINPEYNTIKEKVYVGSEMENEKDLVATLLSRRKLDLKGVRVKDGETLVIGGMIQESEAKSVTKIPFLGDLPLIGMFFRSTNTAREKEEMVIMLTPNIIVDNEDAETSDLL
jgi:type IV pilus assembly protein PilQ